MFLVGICPSPLDLESLWMSDAVLLIQTVCPAAIVITFGLAAILRIPERKNYRSCPPAQTPDEKPTTKGE